MIDFRCVFLDVETTGLDPETDHVISYALREWSLEEGACAFYSALVLPPRDPPPEVCAINGYSRELWYASGANIFSYRHVDDICHMLNGRPIVAGANPLFDIKFLGAEFRRIGAQFPQVSYRTIDLCQMAIPLKIIGHIPDCSLDTLRQYFGVRSKWAHTAEGDVNDSIEVWEAMLQTYLTCGWQEELHHV